MQFCPRAILSLRAILSPRAILSLCNFDPAPIKVATEQVEFSFNKLLYRQIDGIFLGLSLGPTLANIFVGYLEVKIIPEVQCRYYIYVDDCCIITVNIEDSVVLFDKLNNIHNAIAFTKENELHNQLSFLDVLITRKDVRLLTSVYRKSSFTGQYLNF